MVEVAILVICVALFFFYIGKWCGRIEAAIIFSNRINLITNATEKMHRVAELNGEDLSQLSQDEFLLRLQKHLDSNNE